MIKELEIGENCFNEWKENLVIDNYPNLKSIVVKKSSLKKLKSLKICNCEELKTIETEDKAFSNVKKAIIESNSIQFYLIIYLPNLQSFKTGFDSFKETTSLSLLSRIIVF